MYIKKIGDMYHPSYGSYVGCAYHCPSWCSFKSFTTRGPQPLPPHAPVPALVRSLILGNVSQPSKIASLIAFLEFFHVGIHQR